MNGWIIGCEPAVMQPKPKPKPTLKCYDYESCRRACYSYGEQESCKALKFYKD